MDSAETRDGAVAQTTRGGRNGEEDRFERKDDQRGQDLKGSGNERDDRREETDAEEETEECATDRRITHAGASFDADADRSNAVILVTAFRHHQGGG
jgi:hypothetical protein